MTEIVLSRDHLLKYLKQQEQKALHEYFRYFEEMQSKGFDIVIPSSMVVEYEGYIGFSQGTHQFTTGDSDKFVGADTINLEPPSLF